MNLLVHAVGAWIAAEAASGRYPRPVAVGLSMLVSRLGAPTVMMTLAAFAFKRLNQAGAFERLKSNPVESRRRIGDA
ncbi:MAG TPA: hypothetical protein VGV17_22015 [Bosea sp. (in: a-proteobacteria)]|jgi:hypothetical protein|uniref:hypothetical protein n=1 Tax=Bosea sp. (in: a-proteobacteria) TaxID=1871050 RepID=UPI002DDCC985|nr:hypothetical protein [Bosea sp. (in: a-proteobacteria)]HEV2556435.1 hypothetical protein [Bosea sp. (in: a-proteobacteria)]